jgi:hypothetical protein
MTAMAAALSGTLQAAAGWAVVNIAAFPMLVIVLFAVARLAARQNAERAQPAQ